MTAPAIFISYSHKDEEWKDRLVTHLGVLEREGMLDLWDDRRISAGEDWYEEIEQAITTVRVAVLLVTANFLTSTFILGEEVPRLLQRRDKEGLRIIPVIVKPCAWKHVGWLARMQLRPKDGRPLSAGNEYQIDADLAAIAEEVVTISKLSAEAQQDLAPQQKIPTSQSQSFDATGVLTPPFEWCKIPAGSVVIEYGAEVGNQSVLISAFAIAKYPITNAQFQMFVDAPDGYRHTGWWDYSSSAQKWRDEILYALALPMLGSSLPRTYVSWYEAFAYCKWLTHKTRREILLPTEAQWQRAAQGDDNRAFPWGSEFNPSYCNTLESKIGQLSSVEEHPEGASPFGVMDMSGNVWEWCLDEWKAHEKDKGGEANRVIRGGSWKDGQRQAYVASRFRTDPGDRSNAMGFRVSTLSA